MEITLHDVVQDLGLAIEKFFESHVTGLGLQAQ
jgi:hypothetical protein